MLGLQLGTKAQQLLANPAFDDGGNAVKSTAADEENVGGVDLQHLLMGMLPSALGRHRGESSFQNLQQCLLHAFAADIPGDGRILALPGDFINLINVDDAALCRLNIVIRCLNQAKQDVLHILANVAGLGQAGGICNSEGNLQHLGQGLRQEGFAAARRTHHQDVRLLQLHVILLGFPVDALVVVIHSHAQGTLGSILSHHVIVQHCLHFSRGWQVFQLGGFIFHQILIAKNLFAKLNAFIADEHIGAGDQPLDLILGLAAKGAPMEFAAAGRHFILRHDYLTYFPAFRGADRFRR